MLKVAENTLLKAPMDNSGSHGCGLRCVRPRRPIFCAFSESARCHSHREFLESLAGFFHRRLAHRPLAGQADEGPVLPACPDREVSRSGDFIALSPVRLQARRRPGCGVETVAPLQGRHRAAFDEAVGQADTRQRSARRDQTAPRRPGWRGRHARHGSPPWQADRPRPQKRRLLPCRKASGSACEECRCEYPFSPTPPRRRRARSVIRPVEMMPKSEPSRSRWPARS